MGLREPSGYRVTWHRPGSSRTFSREPATAIEAASLYLDLTGIHGSVSTYGDDLAAGQVFEARRGGRNVTAEPVYRAVTGEFVAVDLDKNNRKPAGTFGWGVCRQGHGLQADLPRLSEHEARYLAAFLTEEARKWRPASNGAGARHWFLIRDAQASVSARYHRSAKGQLVRYASHEGAQRAADRLNA
jgi:hypothetical protein